MGNEHAPWVRATVERLKPLIQEHADEGERARRLPMPVVEAMREAGLFRVLSPKSLGGMELAPSVQFDLVEEVSRIDGSTGWCLFIGGGGVTLGRFLADEAAEEVFGNPETIVAGSVFPPGKAAAADGGYRVSGRWSYASGCQHATWIVGISIAFEGDKPRVGPGGAPEMRGALVPAGEARIIDTWDVSGLCSTGSHDFALNDHLVQDKYTFALRPGANGSHYQGPLYRMPFLTTFGFTMGSVASGIALGAIDCCREMAVSKVRRGSELTLQQRPLFQYQLADALATVWSGRAWLREELESAWQLALAAQPIPIEQRARLWLSMCHSVRSAAQAVDIAYSAGGGAANYRSSPLQRALRDVRAVTQHVAASSQSIEDNGRILAGLEPANPLIFL